MAENEVGEETDSHRNEWEVVSLTASAYAASADPEISEVKCDDRGSTYEVDDTEISRPLFISGHFVFPSCQPENLPLESETIEAMEDDWSKGDAGEMVPEGSITTGKDEIGGSFGAPTTVYSKLHLLDDDDHDSIHAKDFEEGMNPEDLNPEDLNPEEETHTYDGYCVSPLLGEGRLDGANSDSTADLSKLSRQREGDDYDSDLPSGAWWKKTAASWYAHAKEANTFWSVFMAAAVMGLVILGQTWQPERWKLLQLKWQMTVSNEKMGRMLAPIHRFKDALVSSHRRDPLIRARSLSKN